MDSTLACLAAWMPRQRWYAAKGRPPSLRLVAWWELDAPAGEPDTLIRTYLVADEGALPIVLYQIPIVARATAGVNAPVDHIVGSPEPGTTFIDAPFDPAYTSALARLVIEGRRGSGPQAEATGRPGPDAAHADPDDARVLVGEQSNTSIIFAGSDGGPPMICKLYRQVHPGLNPDIELASALARAGSPAVPRALGSVEGRWPDPATARGSVTGSLVFAQEFLPDVEDAWRVALAAAAANEDFREPARALGAATADVHVALAALFTTERMDDEARALTRATWQRRLGIAIAEVPQIADLRTRIEAVYTRAEAIPWPDAQRIHGDYHLGQVLRMRTGAWVLLDFEGEPLRPMAERRRPDLALRDIAGMLRSFDYVAGSIRLDDPHRAAEDTRAWASSARDAFLDGWATVSGVDLDAAAPLLAALELDKALYEAIYESRNRPTWVSIPLRAIMRLVDDVLPS